MSNLLRVFQRSVQGITPNASNRRWLGAARGIGGGVNFPAPIPDAPIFVDWNPTVSPGDTTRLRLAPVIQPGQPPLTTTGQIRAVLKFKLGATSVDTVKMNLVKLSQASGAAAQSNFAFFRDNNGTLVCLWGQTGTRLLRTKKTFRLVGGTGSTGATNLITAVIGLDFASLSPPLQCMNIFVNNVLVEQVQFISALPATTPMSLATELTVGGTASAEATQAGFCGQMSEVRFWDENGSQRISFYGNGPSLAGGDYRPITTDSLSGTFVLFMSNTEQITGAGQQIWVNGNYFADPLLVDPYFVQSFVPGVSVTVTTVLLSTYTSATSYVTAIKTPQGLDVGQALGLPQANGALAGVQPQVFFGLKTATGLPDGWNTGLNRGTYGNFVLTPPPLGDVP